MISCNNINRDRDKIMDHECLNIKRKIEDFFFIWCWDELWTEAALNWTISMTTQHLHRQMKAVWLSCLFHQQSLTSGGACWSLQSKLSTACQYQFHRMKSVCSFNSSDRCNTSKRLVKLHIISHSPCMQPSVHTLRLFHLYFRTFSGSLGMQRTWSIPSTTTGNSGGSVDDNLLSSQKRRARARYEEQTGTNFSAASLCLSQELSRWQELFSVSLNICGSTNRVFDSELPPGGCTE